MCFSWMTALHQHELYTIPCLILCLPRLIPLMIECNVNNCYACENSNWIVLLGCVNIACILPTFIIYYLYITHNPHL